MRPVESHWRREMFNLYLLSVFLFLQKSTENMKKIPTIILSITYKGVKFIDASNKVSVECPQLSI